MNRVARVIVLRLLREIHGGRLTIVEDSGERFTFGDAPAIHPLNVTVRVRSPRFYRYLLRGSVGLCESYMDGLWECSDLVGLTRLAARNVRALDDLRRVLSPVLIPLQRWMRWCKRNTIDRSRRQIAAHYDLGNELFSLMLDETMTYSCAFFEAPDASLHQAQLKKFLEEALG